MRALPGAQITLSRAPPTPARAFAVPQGRGASASGRGGARGISPPRGGGAARWALARCPPLAPSHLDHPHDDVGRLERVHVERHGGEVVCVGGGWGVRGCARWNLDGCGSAQRQEGRVEWSRRRASWCKAMRARGVVTAPPQPTVDLSSETQLAPVRVCRSSNPPIPPPLFSHQQVGGAASATALPPRRRRRPPPVAAKAAAAAVDRRCAAAAALPAEH